MQFKDLIGSDQIVLGLRAADKAQALSEASKRIGARLGMDPKTILQPLLARETLGSTGLGRGFALPHARLPGIEAATGLLFRLARSIDFESIDRQPVDIIFVLLLPGEKPGEQMAALASAARSLRNDGLLTAIRKAKTAAALYDFMLSEEAD
jgi:PTS system nitrogen regulatory IIA component